MSSIQTWVLGPDNIILYLFSSREFFFGNISNNLSERKTFKLLKIV